MKNSIFLALSMLFAFTAYSQNQEEYLEGVLIVKVKPIHGEKCLKSNIAIPSLQKIVSEENVLSVEKLFPNHKAPKTKKAADGRKLVNLNTIYRFKFDETRNLEKVKRQLENNQSVEYVEFEYINQLAYTPNDTSNFRQWYLGAIQAFDAWDIEKGDTNVVIAIIDTGSDTAHADLKANFAYNYDDPINGIDDDNDGYIDNFNGWDVANNDNDASYSRSGHGTNVASIASAATDNVTGISGVGFNSRILTVRIDDENTGRLTGAYDGIIFAADAGAFIINNSWGGYNYSNLAQDIVNYAAINKGALVIGAVGNGPFSGPNTGTGIEMPFYPAAYDNVLSVGSLLEGDTIKQSSNFGYWVDIFAPGEDMYCARENNNYGISGGTSMAAPVVSGVAALVKSHFPNYTNKQVMHKLLSTADNVDAVNDIRFNNKMGVGRVNVYKALIDSTSPGIDFENRVITDGVNDLFSTGDTIKIWGNFINYLANANNATASIRVINNKLTVIDGSTNLGNLNTFDSISNNHDPFLLVVNPSLNFNEKIDLEVTVSANSNSYTRKIYLNLTINPDYLTLNENNLTVTITSNGGIGYSGDNNTLGEGIKYLNGNSLLFDGTFIVGNSANYIPNRFRGDASDDDDFEIIKTVVPIQSDTSDFETQALFNDEKLATPTNLEISQINLGFTRTDLSNTIVYVYKIKNTSNSKLFNLHAGLILDWDIENYLTNKVTYDAQRKMGISYSTDTNLYVGVKILSDSLNNFHYGIDNESGGGGGINIIDGFSSAEKYLAISSNRPQAGNVNPNGNDILDVNSVGPFNLEADSSQLIAIAIIVGQSIAELEREADSISIIFNDLVIGIPEFNRFNHVSNLKLYPNPSNEYLTVNFDLKESSQLKVRIHDLQGKLVCEENKGGLSKGKHQFNIETSKLKTGLYLLEINGDSFTIKNNFVVTH
tara:strand:+ start:1 stop:2820 length:2820 start_codon:yes stop_codon:yes gene_type:complete